jgi:hypothetical protein
MVRERRYKHRTSFLMNTDLEVLEDFRKLCSDERKDVSEKLNEMIREEIRKKVMGCNPISVNYNMNDEGIKSSKLEGLDRYIEENYVTSKQWKEFFDKKDSYDIIMKYEALSLTIHKQAKNRANYLKTGRYVAQ